MHIVKLSVCPNRSFRGQQVMSLTGQSPCSNQDDVIALSSNGSKPRVHQQDTTVLHLTYGLISETRQ